MPFLRGLPLSGVADANIPDPYTPPDGTFNITGALSVSGAITAGSTITNTQTVATSGTTQALVLTTAAHTGQTASTEISDVLFDLTATKTWATGAITTQRAVRIELPTYAFAGASTITDAATFYVEGRPAAGTNATITNGYTIWGDAGNYRWDTSQTIASAASAALNAFNIPADTITITGSTGITTATGFNLINVGVSTYSAASALTVTNAATLYLAGAPLGGGAGPATLTNRYTIWVDDGATRFDDTVILGDGDGTASLSNGLIRGPNSSATADTAGSDMRFDGSIGRGAAAIGIIEFRTGDRQASGTTSHGSVLRLTLGNAQSAQISTTGANADFPASTYTDRATAGSGTATNAVAFSFQAPTFAAANSSVVTTNAATVYIAGPPAAGTNMTLTNAYTLWGDAGNYRWDTSQSVASAAGATLNAFTIPANTITITGSTGITTAAGFNLVTIGQPTYSAGSALTVTNAATFTILGAPLAGGAGPAAITNAYALWVQAGATLLSAATTIAVEDAATTTDTTCLTLTHTTTDTAGTLFGSALAFSAEDASASTISLGRIAMIWNPATGGSNSRAEIRFFQNDGGTTLNSWVMNVNRAFRPGTDGTYDLALSGNRVRDFFLARTLTNTQLATTSGTTQALVVTTGAHTGQTASTEVSDVLFDLSATKTWATGALATQRAVRIELPTYAFAGASTITDTATLYVEGAPTAGSNATITNASILLMGGATTIGATAAGTTYSGINLSAHTVTVTGTTQVTSACGAAGVRLGIVTVTDASAVTIDAAATLYIGGAPAAGGSVTLAATYALWVDAGATRFDGNIGFFSTAPVAQGASIADPSGGATQDAECRTATIALITRLEAFGLIATV